MAIRADPILKALGGRRALGARVRNASDLRRSAEQGLPFSALEALARRFRFDGKELRPLLRIPARTLARRRQVGELRPDESDRLLRLARIAVEAARVLGSAEKAAGWLRDPNMALGGEVPLQLLGTDLGARQVEEVLGRIEYGVYS